MASNLLQRMVKSTISYPPRLDPSITKKSNLSSSPGLKPGDASTRKSKLMRSSVRRLEKPLASKRLSLACLLSKSRRSVMRRRMNVMLPSLKPLKNLRIVTLRKRRKSSIRRRKNKLPPRARRTLVLLSRKHSRRSQRTSKSDSYARIALLPMKSN